jgi:hypothetical protein
MVVAGCASRAAISATYRPPAGISRATAKCGIVAHERVTDAAIAFRARSEADIAGVLASGIDDLPDHGADG